MPQYPIGCRPHLPRFVPPVRAEGPSQRSPAPLRRRRPQKTAEADVVLENRDQKHPNEGSEFADPGGYSMPGGAHAHWEDLRRQHKCRHVRPELNEEVAESQNGQEGCHLLGELGDDGSTTKDNAITENPMNCRRRWPMRSIRLTASK